MSTGKLKTNGHEQPNDQEERPANELDVYDQAIRSGAGDDFLQDVNFGLGNYSEEEMWQQVQSYSAGMFGDAAFSRRLRERAVVQTIWELGKEAWDSLGGDLDVDVETLPGDGLKREVKNGSPDDYDRRRKTIEAWGERRWNAILESGGPDPNWERALEEVRSRTGVDGSWRPPQYRMMEARHEISRGKSARLLDNVFGRVTEIRDDASEQAKKRLQGLGGGRR